MISVGEFPELRTLSLDDQYRILRRCRQRALFQLLKSGMGVILLLTLTLNLLLLTVTLVVWPFVLLVFMVAGFWLHHEVRNRMQQLVYVEVRVQRLLQRKELPKINGWMNTMAADSME
jgi:hypothetical protein